MPTAARKSSLGSSRRAAEKKHIPFRADELGRGKKTGMAVRYVDHKSDEFEPFDQVMSQADTRTPPRAHRNGARNGRKSRVETIVEDEDGEMSMEIDDGYGGPESAEAYFQKTRRPSMPAAATRVGSSSRSVPRMSEIDYDSVPSPRPRPSTNGRRSSVYGNTSVGPSHLSQSTLGLGDDDEDDIPMDEGGMEDYGQDDYGQEEDDEPQEQPQRSYRRQQTPRRSSFTSMAQDAVGFEDEDEEEEEEVEEVAANYSHRSDKGKGRAVESYHDAHEEDDVEEEIAQGLEDIDGDQQDEEMYEDPEPEPEPEPPKKKKKVDDAQSKQVGRARKKVTTPMLPESPDNSDGLRRGKRIRYAPLEWWRQEKVVYGRRESGISFVPTIKAIVRIPKEAPQPLGKNGKRKKSVPRGKSKTADAEAMVFNPEEGWDDETETNGVVTDWVTGEEIERRLVFPGRMVNFRAGANNDFFFQKIFGDGEYVAAGQLKIPPKGQKPTKMTKDNTYVFYVIEGAVAFKVHNSTYILCTGGMILVPRGNSYYIENICERDARLFFSQARRVSAEDEQAQVRQPAPPSRTGSAGAPTSASRQSVEKTEKKGKRAASSRA
ncbi:hypothetical protein DENSPDRAFT_834848 [Dentipellis sp. KUC8613]|nr:hypothetical protein DENSPDRAFT_834848 [Dentipellis sp. KUC8613]